VPRTPRDSRITGRGRRRTSRSGGDSRPIVDQIGQIVAANETLQRENRDLAAENERLRRQLGEIGTALGRLTGGRRGRGGRRAEAVEAAPPRRARRPITDPEVLEKRRQALAKARAARAERLAAARAAAGQGE